MFLGFHGCLSSSWLIPRINNFLFYVQLSSLPLVSSTFTFVILLYRLHILTKCALLLSSSYRGYLSWVVSVLFLHSLLYCSSRFARSFCTSLSLLPRPLPPFNRDESLTSHLTSSSYILGGTFLLITFLLCRVPGWTGGISRCVAWLVGKISNRKYLMEFFTR